VSVERDRHYAKVVLRDFLDTCDPCPVRRECTYVYLSDHLVKALPAVWSHRMVITECGPESMREAAGLVRGILSDMRGQEERKVGGLMAEVKRVKSGIAVIGRAERNLLRRFGG
jgi:hypothetical protein